MKLYHFSAYAHRRSVIKAEAEVAASASNLTRPDSAVILKQKVEEWFKLHRQIIKTGTNE